jgi:hypothetical protein
MQFSLKMFGGNALREKLWQNSDAVGIAAGSGEACCIAN